MNQKYLKDDNNIISLFLGIGLLEVYTAPATTLYHTVLSLQVFSP